MNTIAVLAEHRQGTIQDVSFEVMTLANSLGRALNAKITGILFGESMDSHGAELAPWVHRLLVVDNAQFTHFNAEAYQHALKAILRDEKPSLVLIPHTAFGLDLAPSLAVSMNMPIVTDCYDITMENDTLIACKQMYGGKVNARIALTQPDNCLLTIRPSAAQPECPNLEGEIIKVDSPLSEPFDYKKFIDYVEAAAGDVDITQADIVIGVGRGLKEQENLGIVESFADAIGGVLACSRPVVDAGWLPKDRQVGSSGKTIKPKLYIALGISGAFQHVAGLKGAETVVAVNKDGNAPIFGVADYGIVADLLKVVPVLTEKITEKKAE